MGGIGGDPSGTRLFDTGGAFASGLGTGTLALEGGGEFVCMSKRDRTPDEHVCSERKKGKTSPPEDNAHTHWRGRNTPSALRSIALRCFAGVIRLNINGPTLY